MNLKVEKEKKQYILDEYYFFISSKYSISNEAFASLPHAATATYFSKPVKTSKLKLNLKITKF